MNLNGFKNSEGLSVEPLVEQREGGGAAGAIRALESDPGDVLAIALARLGRAMEARKNGGFIGLPA